MWRATLAALALAAAWLALASSASADLVSPESESGSPNAESIDTLFKITLYIGLVIFLLVEGVLVYCLVKFRARRGGPEPPQIRGNTRLELGWTAGAVAIVTGLVVVTFVMLGDIKDPVRSGPGGLARAESGELASIGQASLPEDEGLKIGVNAQQYLFRYDYPGEPALFSYYELVVPTNTTVELEVTSTDVVHAWWVPKVGGKVDAVPGHVNRTWFKLPKPGVYYGQCAELCGENHADMRTRIRAVSPAAYDRWERDQRDGIKAAQRALARSRAKRERG